MHGSTVVVEMASEPFLILFQIGDFGLARDLGGEDLYQSRGGKIPVKWTAPEVSLSSHEHRKFHSSMFLCVHIGAAVSTLHKCQ